MYLLVRAALTYFSIHLVTGVTACRYGRYRSTSQWDCASLCRTAQALSQPIWLHNTGVNNRDRGHGQKTEEEGTGQGGTAGALLHLFYRSQPADTSPTINSFHTPNCPQTHRILSPFPNPENLEIHFLRQGLSVTGVCVCVWKTQKGKGRSEW